MQPKFSDWLNRKPAGKKARKRIPKVSKKRGVQLGEYAAVKRMHLREHPTCQISPIIRAAGFTVRCRGRAKFIHHVRGKIGKLLCDRSHFLSSCDGECHPEWIHQTHVKEAWEIGLLQ